MRIVQMMCLITQVAFPNIYLMPMYTTLVVVQQTFYPALPCLHVLYMYIKRCYNNYLHDAGDLKLA